MIEIRFHKEIFNKTVMKTKTKNYFSIQRGKRGPRKVGRSSQPWIPSSILAFPGSSANTRAETPLISLTVLFNDS